MTNQDNQQPGPTVAVIFMQPACNMHCTFCVTEDNFDAMTFPQAIALLKHLKQIGVRSVVIGGGEPFDWQNGNLIEVAQAAHDLKFKTVQIGTNGINLPEGFENIEAITRYVIPIESAKPEPHNRMRLYRNHHHEIILDRLAKLKHAKKSVTLSTVITEVNKDTILELAEFLRAYHADSNHVHAWHLYQFIPIGRGGALHAPELQIPEIAYQNIYESVQALTLPFKTYRRTDMYASKTVDFFWYHKNQIQRGSTAWTANQQT